MPTATKWQTYDTAQQRPGPGNTIRCGAYFIGEFNRPDDAARAVAGQEALTLLEKLLADHPAGQGFEKMMQIFDDAEALIAKAKGGGK